VLRRVALVIAAAVAVAGLTVGPVMAAELTNSGTGASAIAADAPRPVGGMSTARPPDCVAWRYVCVYFERGFKGQPRDFIHVSELYDCKKVFLNAEYESIYNNTKFRFVLTDGPVDEYYVGTVAPYKGYRSVGGPQGEFNVMQSPGC
jgi:hypothetical protein